MQSGNGRRILLIELAARDAGITLIGDNGKRLKGAAVTSGNAEFCVAAASHAMHRVHVTHVTWRCACATAAIFRPFRYKKCNFAFAIFFIGPFNFGSEALFPGKKLSLWELGFKNWKL